MDVGIVPISNGIDGSVVDVDVDGFWSHCSCFTTGFSSFGVERNGYGVAGSGVVMDGVGWVGGVGWRNWNGWGAGIGSGPKSGFGTGK